MAIPKTGSRRIVVDGLAYRWTVRHRPTYCQGMAWSPLSFAVELESSGNSTLLVSCELSRPDNWVDSPSVVVTPSVIESAIRLALSQGWHPEEKGSPHSLALPKEIEF